MDQAIWRILALSSAVILAACSIQPRVVERAPTKAGEAGKVGVSVISVAPWELYVKNLQPKFNLTPAQALAEATAATTHIEDRFSKTLQTLIKLAPGTLTEERTQVSGDTVSNTTTRRAAPGDLSKVTGPTIPESALPAALPASASFGVNAQLRYHLALALYQEVQLINQHVLSAPRLKGYAPFVVRLLVNARQFGQNTPYNAEVEIDFGPGSEKSCDGAPRAVPMLVNDSMEIASVASARQNVVTLGLALSALRGNLGVGVDTSSKTEQLLKAVGNEYNSVLNVASAGGEKSNCTVSVHIGALTKDIDKHELVTQSHTVTLLLLVPTKLANTEGSYGPQIAYRSSARFTHARTGVPLPDTQTTDSSFEVEFWRTPRLPPKLQFAEFVLTGDKAPYSGEVTLRGGDALVDEFFDRACLRDKGAFLPADSGLACKEGALIADEIGAVELRNALKLSFTKRFDEGSGSQVKIGGKPFDTICIDMNTRGSSSVDIPNLPKSFCTPISNVRLLKPPKAKPSLTAEAKVHERVIVAKSDGSTSLVATVKFPSGASTPSTRPDYVSFVVDGGAIARVEPLGGVTNCATQKDVVRVTTDCSVRLHLLNVSSRSALKVSASAVRADPGGGEDLEVPLEVDGAVPEILLDQATGCEPGAGCCTNNRCTRTVVEVASSPSASSETKPVNAIKSTPRVPSAEAEKTTVAKGEQDGKTAAKTASPKANERTGAARGASRVPARAASSPSSASAPLPGRKQ